MPSKKRTARQRVEQAVEKVISCGWVRECDAVNLILAERRRMRREIQRLQKAHMNKSYMNALDDILARLRG